MSRDYRYGHNYTKTGFQRRSQQQPQPVRSAGRSVGRIWALGVLVSAFFLGGFWIAQHFMQTKAHKAPGAPSEIYTEVNPEEAASSAEANERINVQALTLQREPDASMPSTQQTSPYSFYQGLKQTEVVVDAVPLAVKLDDAYYIYAGSFGSQEIALKEQQRLARFGQVVELSTLTTPVRTYYRLRVGPYRDRLEMNKKRNELRRLGVDTLLIKVPRAEVESLHPESAQ